MKRKTLENKVFEPFGVTNYEIIRINFLRWQRGEILNRPRYFLFILLFHWSLMKSLHNQTAKFVNNKIKQQFKDKKKRKRKKGRLHTMSSKFLEVKSTQPHTTINRFQWESCWLRKIEECENALAPQAHWWADTTN